MEPISAQITNVEENIESIVRRNEVVDEEIQGMKTDMLSLAEKILAIKVSFYQILDENNSMKFDIKLKTCFVIMKTFKENINGTTTFGATCQEYFEMGSKRNGTFSIRPDLSS